jgi:hypothetical protein
MGVRCQCDCIWSFGLHATGSNKFKFITLSRTLCLIIGSSKNRLARFGVGHSTHDCVQQGYPALGINTAYKHILLTYYNIIAACDVMLNLCHTALGMISATHGYFLHAR